MPAAYVPDWKLQQDESGVEVRGWSERVWSLLGLQYWGVVLVWQHEGVGLVDLARCPHGEQISASTVHKCAGVTSRC